MNLLNILHILLLAPPQGGNQNPLSGLLPLVLVGVIFYFFMIRPQMKKTKEQKEFRAGLKKGDKIVTIGGIHGKIVEFEEGSESMLVEVDSNVKLRIEKSAVSMEHTRPLSVKSS